MYTVSVEALANARPRMHSADFDSCARLHQKPEGAALMQKAAIYGRVSTARQQRERQEGFECAVRLLQSWMDERKGS